ncbi:MAG: ABC transporter permease subunit [Clostridiaceae bacterium]
MNSKTGTIAAKPNYSGHFLKKETIGKLKRYRVLYLLLLIPVIHQILFSYLPIYGVTLAFKDFKMSRGILGSSWNNFENFKQLFSDMFFYKALLNTLRMSLLSLFTGFPCTIIFALLLNEIFNIRFKRVIQTISYLPHFLSWVIISGFIYQMLSPQYGIINALLVNTGIIDQPINFIISSNYFLVIYVLSGLWQGIGWGSIIYLSAIASIDQAQYESAQLDGANRFQKAIYITLPGLLPTITVLLLLNIGSLLSVSFEQIFNLYTPATYDVADVIDTFVFRQGIQYANYDYSTAVGLFQNLIGFILLLLSNAFVRKFDNEYTIL